MAYNNNHDCPFEAYITNLGKYNEGTLVGEWVKFPTTREEIQEVMKRIGIDGVQYEEWFITDYDCYVDGLSNAFGEYESLDELNYLAASIEDMDRSDFERFEAAVEVSDYTHSVKDFINLTDNLDKYDIYPGINDYDDLGRMYIDEYGSLEVPEHLKNYIDYEAYGRDIAMDEIGTFTGQGYVRDTGDSFIERYDGNREDIPWEYRVTVTPEEQEFLDEQAEELTEDEKLDMVQEDGTGHEDTMTVLVVEPLKEPYLKELPPGLSAMQKEVDGMIAAAYPFEDPVAIVCNDEGKINGMELNRALRDGNGQIYDIVAGPFLVVGLGEEDFTSLPQELAQKYMEHFKTPEMFAQVNGDIVAIPVPAEEYRTMPEPEVKPAAPDDLLTGEKIKTPRGSFSLTDMTREQMEAAGYGFHHGSDDGRYHIMGNGTRAFAIINENARTYDIYQLKDFPDRRDYAFEPLDRLREHGRSVDMQNYDKVYSGAMFPGENLESIYSRFNMDRPEDFTGHSLSVSDVVVIRQNGQEAAHYCDSFGFAEVPEFLELVQQPETKLTFYVAECIEFTSLGEYHDNLTLQEALEIYRSIPADRMNGGKGIGFNLEDGSVYDGEFGLLSGNIIDADTVNDIQHFRESPLVQLAVRQMITAMPQAELLDRKGFYDYLKNAEMSTEDDYGMIDGIINNGKKEVTPPGPDEKTSIRGRLAEAKRECANRKPPEVKKPEKNGPEHDL